MDLIKDKFERIINYMQISVTDRCNLRCILCMPFGEIKPKGNSLNRGTSFGYLRSMSRIGG